MEVMVKTNLETYFDKFRSNIIGINQHITTPYHDSIRILYADWTASGRMYQPIEDRLNHEIYPFVANTHTDTNCTGEALTTAYHKAQGIIKKHVNANSDDALITCGSGMTGVINKFQRILGIKVHERFVDQIEVSKEDTPVVFITHMEHHSNQTSWLETICDVEIIRPLKNGMPDLVHLQELLAVYGDRKLKMASITAASNVTGIKVDYHKIAKIMHEQNGYCFVDFACAGPYIDINMHPQNDLEALDAIFLSPHKFLGGPGTSGVLVFNKKLYKNCVPDHPGGGTVLWTNPWKEHAYHDNVEEREDGGTPGFLQAIRVAMCIQLKEEMGTKNIIAREHEINDIIWSKLNNHPAINILANEHKDRLGVFSFYIENLHFNVGVKLLNDLFGIQTRGGCSCAGTYGHFLLNVDREFSHSITCEISEGNNVKKPGWIRMSIHPTMTNEEVHFICDSILYLADNFQKYLSDYSIDLTKGKIKHKSNPHAIEDMVAGWFN